MDARTQQLLEGKPLPILLRMASPNALAFLVQSSVSLAEVWFIGQLGTVSLAAIALVFPMLMLTQMMANGALGGAMASSIARALGSGNREKAEELVWHGLVIAFTGALIFLVTFLLFGETFLGFLGGEGEVLEGARLYLTVLFSGGFVLWFSGILNSVFRGTGNMRFPAFLMIANALVQVPLSGGLILGWYGLPQMGIVGAAISAIVSGSLLLLMLVTRLVFTDIVVKLRFDRLRLQKNLFHDILKVAAPAGLSPLVTVITILSLTAIVGSFGEAALAGYGIGSRVEFLLIPLVFGIGASMTTMVGVNIGAENYDRAEKIGWQGGVIAALLAGTAGILLAIFPESWIGQFTTDPDTFEVSRSYIQIVGPLYAFQGIGTALYFASQGAGRVQWPILATLLRFIIAVGGALIAISYFESPIQAIFVCTALGMFAYGSLIVISLRLGAWRPPS